MYDNKYDIIKNRNGFFIFSGILTVVGIVALLMFGGFNMDIDFVGGTNMQYNLHTNFDEKEVTALVKNTLNMDPSSVQHAGANGQEVIIKLKSIDTEKRAALTAAIKEKYNIQPADIIKSDNITPTVGDRLKAGALEASFVATVLILLYIAIRFKYFSAAFAAIIALLHDVFIIITIYALFRIPINMSFVAAVLTILGYSINDTIVVFDRIRENLRLNKKDDFATIAHISIWQTMARSINTSLCTVSTIFVLWIFGVPTVKEFAFPLIIGIVCGTYSSVFIASPLWVIWRKKPSTKVVGARG